MKKSLISLSMLFVLMTQGFTQTDCNPIANFPWTVSFNYTGTHLPDCFDRDGYWNKSNDRSYIEGTVVGANPPVWLFLPAITVTEGAVLKFLHGGAITQAATRNLRISETDKDKSSFAIIESYSNAVMPTGSNPWEWVSIDLSDYVGETIYIAFEYGGSSTSSWRIAEFIITDADARVSALSPKNAEEKAPVDAVVSVTFSKAVSAVDLTNITFTPPVTGVSASVENNVLLIEHDDFEFDTEYTVTVPIGTIEYFTESIVWSFKTWKEPLNVVSVAPENNTTNVDLDAFVSITFDVDIVEDYNFDNITITPAVNDVTAFYRGKTLAIFHRNFSPNTTYTVTIPANAVDRQREDIVWSFTTVANTSNVQELSVETTAMRVEIFPNPSNGVVNVKVAEKSVIKIFDMGGRQLGHYNVGADSELHLNQTPGIYFLRVESNGKVEIHKLIVQ